MRPLKCTALIHIEEKGAHRRNEMIVLFIFRTTLVVRDGGVSRRYLDDLVGRFGF